MNKIKEQKERKSNLPKSLKLKKKNQIKILELKNAINEIKNAMEYTGNITDQMKNRISKLENRILEMIQVEEERIARLKRSKETL